MRYLAPQHTGAVYAPSRPYSADADGVIEIPDDAPEADHGALRSVGCVVITDAAAAPKAKAAKAESDAEAPAEQPEDEPKD